MCVQVLCKQHTLYLRRKTCCSLAFFNSTTATLLVPVDSSLCVMELSIPFVCLSRIASYALLLQRLGSHEIQFFAFLIKKSDRVIVSCTTLLSITTSIMRSTLDSISQDSLPGSTGTLVL